MSLFELGYPWKLELYILQAKHHNYPAKNKYLNTTRMPISIFHTYRNTKKIWLDIVLMGNRLLEKKRERKKHETFLFKYMYKCLFLS